MSQRKTYEKYEQINAMFDQLEQQIVHGEDSAYVRDSFFYLDEFHRQNYESLRLYYHQADDNPLIDGACYVIAIPEIFNVVNVFEYSVPLDFVFSDGALSPAFTQLDVYYQYLIAAVLEVSNIKIFEPTGYSLGMTHWNIHQMRLFWQYTAIIRRHAM